MRHGLFTSGDAGVTSFQEEVLSWEEEASSLYTSGAVGASLRCDTGRNDQTGFQARISEIAAYTIVFFLAQRRQEPQRLAKPWISSLASYSFAQ